jgi:hypothetical protein
VITACACTIVLIFCLVRLGNLAIRMARNEEEMKAAREAYYVNMGVDLEDDAARVELLPPGITYPPTASPPPAPQQEQEQTGALAQDTPAPVQRSRQRQYPDNPLGNIREAFKQPLRENGDLIGRLVIEGLLDEAVVARNNTYYLTHDAGGMASPRGAVFMDEACSIRNPPENLHLRGKGAFAPLAGYAEGGADFVRAHALIGMETLYEEGMYVVFAVVVSGGDSGAPDYLNYAAYPSFESDGRMEAYIAEARQKSLYQIPVDVQPADRLLTLSTLSDGADEKNLVILARMLRPGESPQSFSGLPAGAIKSQGE